MLVAVLVLVVHLGQVVEPDPSVDQLHEINIRLAEVATSFVEGAQVIFYDTRNASRSTGKISPLLAIAAEMAELQATWFIAQRKGLLHAETVLIRYFLAPLEKLVAQNEADIVDLITKRAQERSVTAPEVVQAVERARKKIYLYLRRYGHEAGVEQLAYNYGRFLLIMQARQQLAGQELQESIKRYRADAPMGVAQFAVASMVAIDSLIGETWFDRSEHLRDLRRLRVDIIMARERTERLVEPFSDAAIDSVPMKDVSDYETQLFGEHRDVQSYLDELDGWIAELYRRFQVTMRRVFYEQIEMGQQEGNDALLALSCQVAELEALVFVEQRRMLHEIKRLITRQSAHFDWMFGANKYLVDFVVHHLVAHSIVAALDRVEKRRKKLYLSLVRYETRGYVKDLTKTYLMRIHNLKDRRDEVRLLLDMYKSRLLQTTRPEQLPFSMETVNELVHIGIEMWFSKLRDLPLLKEYLEPDMYNDILTASRKWFNRILRPSSDQISELTSDEINQYERDMLARFNDHLQDDWD